ncbi:hypothetical protein EYF80_032715 [Liparis tanakae]|uniref:Uncharacterized protein n=1 Tax=Liparis tanakae TaxID=230148 RepID=A0A4Z2GUX9_9TELE|nr:hypothetical protein EYF80_032715 [Liparis tanakae]
MRSPVSAVSSGEQPMTREEQREAHGHLGERRRRNPEPGLLRRRLEGSSVAKHPSSLKYGSPEDHLSIWKPSPRLVEKKKPRLSQKPSGRPYPHNLAPE